MKKLYLFIFKSFIGPLTATFLISLFILVMQFLWKYVDDLVGKGLEWLVMGELLTYASLMMVPMALPLAILLASLMTFGNLGENYELTAMKSAGISLPKIMSPLIFLIVLVAIGAFQFSNKTLPVINLKLTSLMHDVRMTKPELDIKERVFYDGIPNYNIKIQEKDSEKEMLRGIMIYDHTNRQENNSNITVADSGKLQVTNDKKFMKLILYNGIRYDEQAEINKNNRPRRGLMSNRDKQRFRIDVFESQTSHMSLTGLGFSRSDENLFKNKYKMKDLSQLAVDRDSILKIHNKLTADLNKRVSGNYFKHTKQTDRTGKTNPKLSLDSVQSSNFDSIFSTLPLARQKTVCEFSLRHARELKQTIEDQSRFIQKEDSIGIRHEMEQHRKLILPFACIVFFFIGAPLGAIIRKGGLGMPAVVSILFFIFYYMVNTFGEKLAREGVWEVYQGMWLSSFVLFIIGIFLTYKSTTDSALLNSDAYYIFFEKLLKKKPDVKTEEN